MSSDSPARDAATALLSAARAELTEHGPTGVSLRAVARRAGVSHAAPKHHFQDRAGLLTALAVDGFRRLTAALNVACAGGCDDPADRVAALGRAYLDFGLAHPALFELMFRPDQLHRDDPALAAAHRESFGILLGAVGDATERTGEPAATASLISWALAHGLVGLVRDGALAELTGGDGTGAAALARELTGTFTAYLRDARR